MLHFEFDHALGNLSDLFRVIKLHLGRFRVDIRKTYAERVIKEWSRLPREVIESPSFEVSKSHLNMLLKVMV